MHQPTLSKEAFQIATYAAAGASLSSLLAKNHPHITSLGPSYPMIIASLFGACTSIAKTALAALHPLYVRNEGPWNVHASNHIDKALYYTIAVCSLLSHPNTAPSLLNTVEAIRDKAFAFLLLLSTTRCLLALLILSNSTLLVFQRIVGLALIHTIQAAERALGRAPPPPPVLYDILFPLNQRNQSLLPSPPKWPFIDIPKLYPTAQALTLPSQSIDVLTQAAPRIGWETLQQIKGCEHLYQRLKEEVQGVATNKANYYPRLKAYAGYGPYPL